VIPKQLVQIQMEASHVNVMMDILGMVFIVMVMNSSFYFIWFFFGSFESHMTNNCFKNSLDINECALGTHNCSTQATCTNIQGSFICQCNDGYEGNGTSCSGMNYFYISFLFFDTSITNKKKKIKMNVQVIMEDVILKQHVLIQLVVSHVNVKLDIQEMVLVVMVLLVFFSFHSSFIHFWKKNRYKWMFNKQWRMFIKCIMYKYSRKF